MRRDLWPWLALAAAVTVLIVALNRLFPGAVSGQGWASVGYMVGLIVLVAAGVFRLQQERSGALLKYVAIWAAIVAVLALAWAYRGVFGFA